MDNKKLKNQLENCYCNRTDCSSRIKDSKKYDSLVQKVEKQQKEYKELLKYADRVLTIDTEKIELGTKFYIQFDGEEEKELFTSIYKEDQSGTE